MVSQYDVLNLGSDTCNTQALLNLNSKNCFTGNTFAEDGFTHLEYGCLWSAPRDFYNAAGGPISLPIDTPLNQVTNEAGEATTGIALTAAYFWFVTNFFVFSCNPHLVQRLYLAEKDDGLKKVGQMLIFAPFFAMTPGVLAGILVISNWPKW